MAEAKDNDTAAVPDDSNTPGPEELARNPFHNHDLDPAQHPSGVHLEWSNITYSVPVGKGETKTILHGLSGQVPPGSLCAVMGPSGSGKSTTLDILAGRIQGFEGTININGSPRGSNASHFIGYVTQDTTFFPHLTVRETLMFTARLRLKGQNITQSVNALLEELDLMGAAGTSIGLADERGGISGGERRRLLVAMELLSDPSLLYLDEPTSGLDSTSAVRLVETLRRLARNHGKTVLCSIHQPRASILQVFDYILLLAQGRMVYFGPTWTAETQGTSPFFQFFESVGHPIPMFDNPADFVLDLVNSTDTGSTSGDSGTDIMVSISVDGVTAAASSKSGRAAVVSGLASEFSGSRLAAWAVEPPPRYLDTPVKATTSSGYTTSWWKQFGVLFHRSFLQKLRDPAATLTQFFNSVVFGVIMMALFWNLSTNQAGARDREGAISLLLITLSFLALDIILVFPIERRVYLRDNTSGLFRSSAFYVARSLAETPTHIILSGVTAAVTYWGFGFQADVTKFFNFMLIAVLLTNVGVSMLLFVGTVSKDVATSNLIATLMLLVYMMFSSTFISPDSIPRALRWVEAISFISHGVKAATVNELSGLELSCELPNASQCFATGDEYLAVVGLDDVDIALQCWYMLIQAVVFRVLAFFTLHFMHTGQTWRHRLAVLA